MKTNNLLYFIISLVLTIFGVVPRIILLLDDVINTQNGGEVVFFYPLTIAGLLIGPVLCIVFLRLWIKELRVQKMNASIQASTQTPVSMPVPSSIESPMSSYGATPPPVSVPVSPRSTESPRSLKNFGRVIACIWVLLLAVKFFEYIKREGGASDASMSFMLMLPFIIFLVIAIFIVRGVARTIVNRVTKK